MKSFRLNGLDLARLIAFAGMVIVNFQVVMLSPIRVTGSIFESALTLFEGKAAATFVVLAGIGVSLAYQRKSDSRFNITMLKRACFLLVIGIINMLIFGADIMHYYAFYFAFGIWLLPLSKRLLFVSTLLIILAFPALMLIFSYDKGWNWTALTYSNIWTVTGFARNLFFNGWHPVMPWLAFFTFGIFLAKLDLSNKVNAWRMFIIGGLGMVLVPVLSQTIVQEIATIVGQDAATVFATAPIPPGPLYMMNGMSAAMLVIGVCLLLPDKLYQNAMVKALCHTGQQTLTLYFAHILIGMSILEALGLVGTTSTVIAFWAAILFVTASIIFANLWRKGFTRGPIEELMRRTTT